MRVNSSPNGYQPTFAGTVRKQTSKSSIPAASSPKQDQYVSSAKATVRFGTNKKSAGAMQRHIQKGLGLIKAGEYEEAMMHFSNKNALKPMGIHLIYGPVNMLESIPTSPEGVKAALGWVEKKNWFKNHDSIQLSQLVFAKSGEELEPQTPEERKALRQLQHEQALMFAEEHLHALQEMKGRNLTYHPQTAGEHDDEIDIATTLAKLNVPLTEAFLKRYKRADHVQEYLKASYD
ncbi:MAG: hypothetical protein K0Q50_1481 [Vampirovibrio sp.]|jgi:hypothetical protein|nr:hypothetical protein [Vampirovibrio sp.]